MKLNKINEVWNSANPFFTWHFGLCHLEILLPWQRDITTSSLLGICKVDVLFYIHVPYQTQSTVVRVGPSISCYKYFRFYSDSGLKESMEPNIRQLQISTRLKGDNLISEHILNVVCTHSISFSVCPNDPLYSTFYPFSRLQAVVLLSSDPMQQIVQVNGKKEERLGQREEKGLLRFLLLGSTLISSPHLSVHILPCLKRKLWDCLQSIY